MVDPELFKIWKVAESNMIAAKTLLPKQVGLEELKEFQEYLDHNELELAMDELDRIGQQHDCRGGFWRNLERAATAMKLSERTKEFRQRFQDAI